MPVMIANIVQNIFDNFFFIIYRIFCICSKADFNFSLKIYCLRTTNCVLPTIWHITLLLLLLFVTDIALFLFWFCIFVGVILLSAINRIKFTLIQRVLPLEDIIFGKSSIYFFQIKLSNRQRKMYVSLQTRWIKQHTCLIKWFFNTHTYQPTSAWDTCVILHRFK